MNYNIIIKKIKVHANTLSNIAISNLIIHIAIAYKRIDSGYHISLYKTDVQDIREQREYEVAKEIVTEVEEKLQVDCPPVETAYIAIHLLGTKLLSQTTSGDSDVEQVLDKSIQGTISTAHEQIDGELH